jgi:diguanylate cyclase (GGDEF)-like protein/PAS domain S-box-containing protein
MAGNRRLWDRNIQILFVDRDPLDVGSLAAALPPNVATVVAGSAADALRLGDRGEFDLVVVSLPGADEDPLSVLDDVRVGFPASPVLALSRVDDQGICEAARARGALECRLRRGLTAPEFASTVGRLLGSVDPRAEIAGRAAHVESVLAAVREGIVVQSRSGRVVLATDRVLEMLHLPRAALISSDLVSAGIEIRSATGRLLEPDELPDAVARRSRGSVPPMLLQMRVGNGEQRWFEAMTSPLLRAGEAEPYAVVTSFRDVTEAQAAHEALVGTERRERLLREYAGDGYLLLDSDGTVREASDLVERFWSRDDLVGKDVRQLFVEDDRAELSALFDDVLQFRASPLRIEGRALDRRAGLRWIELTLSNRLSEPSLIGIVANLRDVTDRKRAEDTVMRLSSVVDSYDDAIYSETLEGIITSWNAGAERLYGYSAQEAIGMTALIITPAERLSGALEVRERILRKNKVALERTVRRRKDDSEVEVSLLVVPLFDSSGNLIGSATTARPAVRQTALPGPEIGALGIEHGTGATALLDQEGRITHANAAFARLLGREEFELVGRHPSELLHPGDMEARPAESLGPSDPARYAGERNFISASGAIVNALVEVSPLRAEDGSLTYLLQAQDVTRWRRSEAQLEHHVLHDPLTGLPNRTMLAARLDVAGARNRHDQTSSALVALDVDRFRVVNDGLGHAAGDELLREVAARLVEGSRPDDLVTRFGSDEFVLLRERVAGPKEAEEFGSEVLALFSEPFVLEGRPVYVSVSCGVAIVDGVQPTDDALRSVEAAMHWAQERGGDQVARFSEAIAERAAERFDMEREIRFAIERDELRVLYQPILTVDTAELVGLEALIRWDHPTRGSLAPEEFIPVAERSGLINALGAFVLETALSQVVAWRRYLPGCERLWVSVNFSSRQLLLSNPVTTCLWALAASGAPADALRLELTETAIMQEIETSISRLEDLRSIGIKVAIDDFGTGHSSLSYLNRLPVGSLKVDQSFIEAIESENAAAIVDTIVNLARALKLELCAEGVENPDQRLALYRLGCDYGQGYLWSRPLTAEEFEQWVRETLPSRESLRAR